MGFVLLAAGEPSDSLRIRDVVAALPGSPWRDAALDAAFYATHHVLVKGALFLATGVVAASSARRLWLALLPAAVLALR